jgi:hypothetical protein
MGVYKVMVYVDEAMVAILTRVMVVWIIRGLEREGQ